MQPSDNIHELVLELDLLSLKQANHRKRCVLTLIDCAYLDAAIDLDGKRIVGGALAAASCDVSSGWKDDLQKRSTFERGNSLAPYLHFRFLFIHPGGEVNVLAKDFALVDEEGKDVVFPR